MIQRQVCPSLPPLAFTVQVSIHGCSPWQGDGRSRCAVLHPDDIEPLSGETSVGGQGPTDRMRPWKDTSLGIMGVGTA